MQAHQGTQGTAIVAAWVGAGSPPCGKEGLPWQPVVRCGSCGHRGRGAPAHRVLSWSFSTWDAIRPTDAGTRWLCEGCAWAYRNTHAKRHPYTITWAATGTTTHHTPAAALAYLRNPTIPGNVAIAYPVGGRRIPLPTAAWGHVAYDGVRTRWGRPAATAIRAALALRECGLNERSLAEPDGPPPHGPIRDLARAQRAWAAWAECTVGDIRLRQLCIKATRP